MNKQDITKEFQKIKKEIMDKPNINGPFPPSIIHKRELLLFGQVWLSKILEAKIKKDTLAEKFNAEIYDVILSHYYVPNRTK